MQHVLFRPGRRFRGVEPAGPRVHDVAGKILGYPGAVNFFGGVISREEAIDRSEFPAEIEASWGASKIRGSASEIAMFVCKLYFRVRVRDVIPGRKHRGVTEPLFLVRHSPREPEFWGDSRAVVAAARYSGNRPKINK